MNRWSKFLIVVVIAVLVGTAFVYGGFFNVAADEPHWSVSQRLIELIRERSVALRSRDVGTVPMLDDPKLLAVGAEHYAEMCSECHLAPGIDDSEVRAGLYPRPPNLVEHGGHRSPVESFWIIKHGLKMTGMPAWGVTHDDESIWGVVAFLRKLPTLSQAQYRHMVEQGRAAGHVHFVEGSKNADAEGSATDDGHVHSDQNGHHRDSSASDVAASKELTKAPRVRTQAEETARATLGPAQAVDAFTRALASGDEAEAIDWLAPNVLIFESAQEEGSREEYMAHHLKHDIEFMSQVEATRLSRIEGANSDLAWVASRMRLSDRNGKESTDAISAETMILRHEAGGWRIHHIHWSSAQAKE